MNEAQPGDAIGRSPHQPETSADELAYRLRQQDVLVRFGRIPLETRIS
jgi:hypothetical protein